MQRLDNLGSDLVLHFENVGEFTIETLRPEMCTIIDRDQLWVTRMRLPALRKTE